MKKSVQEGAVIQEVMQTVFQRHPKKTFFHTAFTTSVVLLPHHETKFYPIRIILNSSSVSAVGLMTSQLTPAAAEVEDTDRQNFVAFNVAVSSQSQTAVVKPKCLGF